MTYRLPRTLPYLSALLSVVLMAGLSFAPNHNGPVSPLGYVLMGAFAALILGSGIIS